MVTMLTIAHARARRALSAGDNDTASKLVRLATQLFWASCAAFRLTGDVTPTEFNTIIRPSMEPPYQSEGFTGLWSADHAALLREVRALGPMLRAAGAALAPARQEYLLALDAVWESHAFVCDIHVSGPSLAGNGAGEESAGDVIRSRFKVRALRYAGVAGGGTDDRR